MIRTRAQRCHACGYDLAGLDFARTHACPECGGPAAVLVRRALRPAEAALVGAMMFANTLWIVIAVIAAIWTPCLGVVLLAMALAVAFFGLQAATTLQHGLPSRNRIWGAYVLLALPVAPLAGLAAMLVILSLL